MADPILLIELSEHALVVTGIHNNSHVFVVFRCCTNHSWTANINILNSVFQRATFIGNRFSKGIQVHDNHIDRRDVLLLHNTLVDIAATCQDEDRRCRRHLGLNDVVVFKRLLVGDDARWRDGRLRVGWFAVGCANRSATEPWAAAALRYAEVGAHGTNFCPSDAADAPVSPFNLFRYVAHAKGRNGVMGGGERFPYLGL